MKINTINTKADHLAKGMWTSGTGPITVIILGSCRVVPFAQFFEYLNSQNRFTIHLIDVVHFYYDTADKQTDPAANVRRFENNPATRKAIADCQWFIHEHTATFGMFNSSRKESINIYDYGMKPELDLMIPNFNDLFILFQDIVNFHPEIRAKASKDLHAVGGLLPETKSLISIKGLSEIEKFLHICDLSSFPEFAQIFRDTWTKIRYFWTCNHISTAFTSALFRIMCDKHLNLNPTPTFWNLIASEDLYANPHTPITVWDREVYGIEWNEPTQPLLA